MSVTKADLLEAFHSACDYGGGIYCHYCKQKKRDAWFYRLQHTQVHWVCWDKACIEKAEQSQQWKWLSWEW